VLKSFTASKLGLKMAIVECNGMNRGDEPDIVAALKEAGLASYRVGEDILGLRPGAINVTLSTALELAGLEAL
jgi:hypothetical protein